MGRANGWVRHGECNGCGDCCRVVAREALVRDPRLVEDVAFYEARGFKRVSFDGREVLLLLASLVAPCPELDGDSCRSYDRRPKTCREFPVVPFDVVGTRCSYWFERDGSFVGGAASPHPTDPVTLVRLESRA